MSATARASLLAALVAATLLGGGAAVALDGRAVDAESGAPVPNVTLSIVGRTQTARSDADGRFVLVPAPRPPFEVLAVLPGGHYARPIRVEELPADGPLVIMIEPATREAVTVTGVAPGIHASPASGSTVVTRDDLRTRESRNLTQVLENVPGVNSVSEGQASVPAIRGLAQARSLVLIDGARVTAERRAGPSATFVDPFVLEGVEVARGPGSVAYGSDAFGGVIMARTRRAQPGADLGFAVSGTLGAGVPQQRVGVEVESGIGERNGLLVSAHARSFDDYDSPEGEVLNSGSSNRGALVSSSHLVGGGLLSVTLQVDRGRDIERPRTNSDVVRFYYPTEDSTRLTVTFESGPLLGFDSTELSLFVGDYRIVTDQDRYATMTEPRSIERADVDAGDFGLRAGAERHAGEVRFDFGIDLNGRFDLSAEDVTVDFDLSGMPTTVDTFTTIEKASRIDSAAYVSAYATLHPVVSVSGGVRFDSIRTKNEGGFFGDVSITNSEPSGFAAVTLGAFGPLTASAQYSHGFRDARLSDRFFRGVTGAGFITGNPDLEPETSDQYDLAFHFDAGRWRPSLYAYHYRIDDLIERFEDPLQPDFFFFRNRGRARIRGIELEVLGDLPRGVSLLVSGSVADGEALDDGGNLDDIAPPNLVVQARKTLGDSGWVQLRGAWSDDLDEPGPGEIPVDSRTVVDVSGGWRLLDRLELQLLVRNVFDESYLLTADDRSPLAPGVSASLSARVEF